MVKHKKKNAKITFLRPFNLPMKIIATFNFEGARSLRFCHLLVKTAHIFYKAGILSLILNCSYSTRTQILSAFLEEKQTAISLLVVSLKYNVRT